MQYRKKGGTQGAWVKASELTNGIRAKLVSETTPVESEFGTQDVAKIRFENDQEVKNVRLNSATINALIEAFGDDSKEWINKYLTVHTEKMIVGGKRVTALYLVPEGFTVAEDEAGYIIVTRKEDTTTSPGVDGEVIDTEDIPF